MNYTPRELMVVCAARQIRDGEKVFVGMRLPLLAFALAKLTHAPNCIGLFENGLARATPAAELLYTMGDLPNVTGALWATHTVTLLGLMAAGEVQLGFIGGAEIDRYGNLNTSAIGDWQRPTVRLPGSGGGADIASLAQRLCPTTGVACANASISSPAPATATQTSKDPPAQPGARASDSHAEVPPR